MRLQSVKMFAFGGKNEQFTNTILKSHQQAVPYPQICQYEILEQLNKPSFIRSSSRAHLRVAEPGETGRPVPPPPSPTSDHSLLGDADSSKTVIKSVLIPILNAKEN